MAEKLADALARAGANFALSPFGIVGLSACSMAHGVAAGEFDEDDEKVTVWAPPSGAKRAILRKFSFFFVFFVEKI